MTRLQAIAAFRQVSADADWLAAFYTAIGFEISGRAPIDPQEMRLLGLSGGGQRISLSLGASRLDLDQFDAAGAPFPPSTRSSDQCFQHLAIRSLDAEADWQHAFAAGAQTVSHGGAVLLPPETGSVTAVKLRDPEGHPLEFLQFPEARTPGIDHSAIVTRDAEASLAFYRACGLTGGKGSSNHGATQEQLDGLDRVQVAVLPLLPPIAHPHLELLAYRDPVPCPSVWRTCDLAATRIVWAADHTALLADPDGHLHQLLAS